MKFRWTPPAHGEWSAGEPPPVWLYVALFVLIECGFLAGTVATWPHEKPMASEDFVRTALAAPFSLWIAVSFALYAAMYDSRAFEVAVKNAARRHLLTRWQRKVRTGVAVLDSVMLVPEPDLAERMLKLEGSPPDNPGRVMRLDGIEGADGVSREREAIEKLLTPLAARLAQATRGGSFDIVMQCEHAESYVDVQVVWAQLQLPGKPRIRWLNNDKDPGFADIWFESGADTAFAGSFPPAGNPEYRLVLAWHLNGAEPDVRPDTSEAAVALLLGSPALMQETPQLKRQAWLLRQIVADADEVDKALARLLAAEQVPHERIRHFWHSRLKGMALHAMLGAVKDTELKVEKHALDSAMGPQAPVARWLLQALAAKMAHFGQGAQLVALPRPNGAALNVVVKDKPAADIPWKSEYTYVLFPWAELSSCMGLWTFMILMSPNETWGTFETVFSITIGVVVTLSFVWRIFLGPRLYTNDVLREYG
ncbi:hypothetical protein [Burkholderia lata]|uniref:Transmembrane protein n=1 Tax=Burkholderia lata (strain ATCC 17760 / DSM 23089 / LMG 22485 / NCIMB 9086 / R18194 / 383) TaxID=482957 RepID=A0A6P2GK93_BURL3|nr:hypothetical protein [Burkholderia lata]VWB04736.1 hypothetical protein BLA15945_00008 [Burkholderia lata]VWC47884.1 hypothetical protein BLA15816_07628 [Burkholderia lata]